MSCLAPVRFRGGLVPLPCSRCEPCRRRRRGEAVSRLMVEAMAHSAVCMVTLTYNPRHLPSDGSLIPSDVSSFLKRLRRRYERAVACDRRCASLCSRLRVFAVGEYGGRFGRPHYHLLVFGLDHRSRVAGLSLKRLCELAWRKAGSGSMGFVDVGRRFSFATAAYLSGYVTKGHNVAGHAALAGRHPEFSRWPNGPRGGLGVPGLSILFPSLVDGRGRQAALSDSLPHRFECGSGERWLGRFLTDKLRSMAGLTVSEVRELKAKAVWLRSWWLALGGVVDDALRSALEARWPALGRPMPAPFIGMLRAVRASHALS